MTQLPTATVALLAFAATLGAQSPPAPSIDTVGQEPTSLLALAGFWIVEEEDGPQGRRRVIRADATRWQKAARTARLEEKARALFPKEAAAFAAAVEQTQAFPFAAAPNVTPLANGDVTVQFKLIGGATDQFAGIVFGLQPDATYYGIRYNTRDGSVGVWRVRGGAREYLAPGKGERRAAVGAWHELKLRVAGTAVEGFLDGERQVTFTLPATVTGRVGLWTKPDSDTAFRDLVVTWSTR
jgi:hypothetical protein